MLLELTLLEFASWAAGLFGIKLAANRKAMMGLNQPRELPIVDRLLYRQIGKSSRMQREAASLLVRKIRVITKYRAFEYLVLFGVVQAQKRVTNKLKGGKRCLRSQC